MCIIIGKNKKCQKYCRFTEGLPDSTLRLYIMAMTVSCILEILELNNSQCNVVIQKSTVLSLI